MLIELAPFIYDELRSSDFPTIMCGFSRELGYAFTEARTRAPAFVGSKGAAKTNALSRVHS